MKRYLFFLLFCSNISFAQNDYNQLLKNTVDLVENNYVSFEDHIEGKEDYYNNYLKKEIFRDHLSSQDELIRILVKYIEFFNDKHLALSREYLYNEEECNSNNSKWFESEIVNSKTVYLKINSFSNSKLTSQLLKKSLDVDSMNHRDNLIIDLRENGGGNYKGFHQLLQFIATNNIYMRNTKLLVTKENWECHKQRVGLGEYNVKYDGKLMTSPWENSEDYLVLHYKHTCTYEYPKRVAILVGRNTGSAAEQFVLCGKQSLKVKIFGQNTSGTVDNGFINSYELIKDSLYLNYATTKKIDFDSNEVTSKGISPDFYLDNDNQVKQILKYFEYWDK